MVVIYSVVESLYPLVWEESRVWGSGSSNFSLNFNITITWVTSKMKGFCVFFLPVLSIHFLKIEDS